MHTHTAKATHSHSYAQSVRASISVLGCWYTCQVGRGPAACTPQRIVGRPDLQQRKHCMWGCWSHMQWNRKCHHQDRPLHTLHNLSAPLQATKLSPCKVHVDQKAQSALCLALFLTPSHDPCGGHVAQRMALDCKQSFSVLKCIISLMHTT